MLSFSIFVLIIPNTFAESVPEWVKNTAGWWATNQISETEFVNAIKFLIESGLINISSYTCDQSEDRDRNGVPDIIETAPVLSWLDPSLLVLDDTEFTDKNWSNCYFPKDLSPVSYTHLTLPTTPYV